ncbi:MAG: NAD-dependent epimerase/dehydratase [Chloroflexi bacterium]|nr:NAD-dependent epimerase/dehydratase [Chloroflexota bacterium]
MNIQGNFLITGGAGFIGSHLCEQLLEQGHSVVAIDDLSTGRLENIQHLQRKYSAQANAPGQDSRFQFVRESISNALVLDRLTSNAQTVIHLAAAVGVKLIVDDPVYTIRTNIMGTEAVLNAANRYGCKVLIASTSEVYGKGVKIPFREEDDRLMGPTTHSRWAYASSKAVDEFLGLAYHSQFSLPVIIVRLFNTVGPRQTGRYGMVVPRFVRQALNGEPLTVFGDGKQSRCFTDVADVVNALSQLVSEPKALGQVFNLGSTQEITIFQLAERVKALTGSNSEIQFVPYSEAYAPGFDDMRRRVPSIEKIQRLIGFQPTYTLDDTLKRVISFERQAYLNVSSNL